MSDIKFMNFLVKTADYLLNRNGYEKINFSELFSTFQENMKEELDFKIEVLNGKKTRKNFLKDPNVYVPRYFDDYCSSRAITMEFVRGVKINDKDAIVNLGLNPIHASHLLINTLGSMIFLYGHVHCDAHPGNILIRKNPLNEKIPQLILLDHGFYRKYDSKFRTAYSRLWIALVERDSKVIDEVSEELGIGEFSKYLPMILLWRVSDKQKLGQKITDEDRKRFRSNATGGLEGLEKINEIMRTLPRHMMFIIRASNLVAIYNTVLGG